ncbi:MAG: acyl-CoA dehydrogenase family protein, partial [Alphaproteobacteria bacterium]|nr:acyl-CoA dehydrogenase family protein [Alphaproteobacteria bacterium]
MSQTPIPARPPTRAESSDVLLARCERALAAADTFFLAARSAVGARVAPGGRIDAEALDREQTAAHALAWVATYVETLRQALAWARRLDAAGALGATEALILEIGFGEYLAQLRGGLAMSQVETARPETLGLGDAEVAAFAAAEVRALIVEGTSETKRMQLAALLATGADSGSFGAAALGDQALDMVRDQFRRFADAEVTPHAHGWHLKDELIPLPVVEQLAAMGVFGLTVPEEWGGLGLGKLSMVVVSEELSRGYIGVGSLGTRSEIAAELVRAHGTPAQKERYLRRLASGEILPTAVFTEPG